ncbi:hypothetical protein [Aquirufa echingensis]|jgi:hypothetical protein|uniref:Uncharacterized protein n=1 Tax=Aquirufa echingensis TaxID=3096516 RepID=A0ABW6CZI2_9BACT
MKNVIAFFLFMLFFSGSLIPKVGLEQSFKANELLKHFQDHKKISGATFRFIDFLWMHYAADSKHNKTTKHPSLPHFDFSGSAGFVLPLFQILLLIPFVLLAIRRLRMFWENQYQFSLERVLIAPPRA